MTNTIQSTIACNLDVDILAASLPLLQEGRVEAMEWSFDTLFKIKEVPTWFHELVDTFSKGGGLIGHGVFFSLFAGKWLPQQQTWLKQLAQICEQYKFQHITEHFGFMTGSDFHHGAPLSIPYTKSTLAIGRDRLMRIQDACKCPVGLENLAFSFSLDEVKQHGEFLNELVEPINGFLILDLHNVYCQLHNFSVPFDDLIKCYPLHRVREIHISGGSWEPDAAAPDNKVRRDTHDESVPAEVFQLLQQVMPLCPNLKYVVLEQLGNGLKTEESRQLFYNDFLSLEKMVKTYNETHVLRIQENFLPLIKRPVPEVVVEDEALYQQQLLLSQFLELSPSLEILMQRLHNSTLAHSDWNIESWTPYMLETARNIACKWKKQQS